MVLRRTNTSLSSSNETHLWLKRKLVPLQLHLLRRPSAFSRSPLVLVWVTVSLLPLELLSRKTVTTEIYCVRKRLFDTLLDQKSSP